MKNIKNSITVPGVNVEVLLTNKLIISLTYTSFPHVPDNYVISGYNYHEIKHC